MCLNILDTKTSITLLTIKKPLPISLRRAQYIEYQIKDACILFSILYNRDLLGHRKMVTYYSRDGDRVKKIIDGIRTNTQRILEERDILEERLYLKNMKNRKNIILEREMEKLKPLKAKREREERIAKDPVLIELKKKEKRIEGLNFTKKFIVEVEEKSKIKESKSEDDYTWEDVESCIFSVPLNEINMEIKK